MKNTVNRKTVDLSDYPNLVVIYLGMRVNKFKGIKTLLSFGQKIQKEVTAKPDGLLLHENLIFSLMPLHIGMRQYWRDFESLESWTRSVPHKEWWQSFLRDSAGTGFWHETYFMQGGMEAIYDDVPVPTGFAKFAPVHEARGAMFSARKRSQREGESEITEPVTEKQFYGSNNNKTNEK